MSTYYKFSKSIPQTQNYNNNNKFNTYVDWYIKRAEKPDEKFLLWISKVEKSITKKLSMSLTDLPDEDYVEYFNSKYSPSDMVKIIYETNGFE